MNSWIEAEPWNEEKGDIINWRDCLKKFEQRPKPTSPFFKGGLRGCPTTPLRTYNYRELSGLEISLNYESSI